MDYEDPSRAPSSYGSGECPSVESNDSNASDAKEVPRELPSRCKVIVLTDYLERRVYAVKSELKRVERQTSLLMNRLIHEKDHSIARKLQQEIGRMDERHTKLNDRLKLDESRYHQYTAVSA